MNKCKYRKCKKDLPMNTKRQEYCNPRCRVKESKQRAKEKPPTPKLGSPSIIPEVVDMVFFQVWGLLALIKLGGHQSRPVVDQLTILHLNLMSYRGHPVVDFVFRKIEQATKDFVRVVKVPFYGRPARVIGASIVPGETRVRLDDSHEELSLAKADFEPRWPALPTTDEDDGLEQEWPFVNPKSAKTDICLAVLAINRRQNPSDLPHKDRRGARVAQIAHELRQPVNNTLSAVEMAMDDGLIDCYAPGPAMEQQWFITTKGVTLGTVEPEQREDKAERDAIKNARRCACGHRFDQHPEGGALDVKGVVMDTYCSGFGTEWVRKQRNPGSKAHTVRKAEPELFCCGNAVTEDFGEPDKHQPEDCKKCLLWRNVKGTEGMKTLDTNDETSEA